jgi:hypothetical protein
LVPAYDLSKRLGKLPASWRGPQWQFAANWEVNG